MEPTHRHTAIRWNTGHLQKVLGRAPTEDEYTRLSCWWAGQLGHEKCGYCLRCNKPRFMKDKECNHPPNQVWKG